MSHLKHSCTGISNIDLEAAKERGIAVCNSPGINAATTAEGALTLMLMLARRMYEQEVSQHSFCWPALHLHEQEHPQHVSYDLM